MADWEPTTVAPGVRREDYVSGYQLIGTKSALLASGLAREDWFWNGRRGVDGRRLTTVHFRIDGNRGKCRPGILEKGEFTIDITYPKKELAKRYNAWKKAKAASDSKNALMLGAGHTLAAFNAENNPEKRWHFPSQTVEQVRWHLREILHLFNEGGFALQRDPPLPIDADFQRFMGRAINGDK